MGVVAAALVEDVDEDEDVDVDVNTVHGYVCDGRVAVAMAVSVGVVKGKTTRTVEGGGGVKDNCVCTSTGSRVLNDHTNGADDGRIGHGDRLRCSYRGWVNCARHYSAGESLRLLGRGDGSRFLTDIPATAAGMRAVVEMTAAAVAVKGQRTAMAYKAHTHAHKEMYLSRTHPWRPTQPRACPVPTSPPHPTPHQPHNAPRRPVADKLRK